VIGTGIDKFDFVKASDLKISLFSFLLFFFPLLSYLCCCIFDYHKNLNYNPSLLFFKIRN
jgi:hypothetical protein